MDILSYFFQNPQAMQPTMPQGNGPIQSGSMAGMQAARQSLQADEDQRRRAMGIALSRFAGNLSKPGYGAGSSGNLANMNEGLSNAVQAYAQEDARSQQTNAALMAQQQEEARREREWQHTLEREKVADALNQKKLGILGEKSEKQSKQEREALEIEKRREQLSQKVNLPEGSHLFEEYTPGERNQIYKDLIERQKEGLFAIKGKKALKNMMNVVEENPELWNSFGTIVDAASSKDTTMWNNVLKGANKKNITALTKIKKYMTTLGIQELKTMGGRPSDIMKKAVFETIPNGQMTPEAIKEISTFIGEGFDIAEKDGRRVTHALRNRYNIPREYPEEFPEPEKGSPLAPEKIQQNAAGSTQGAPDFSQMSTEQLLQERQKAMQAGSR